MKGRATKADISLYTTVAAPLTPTLTPIRLYKMHMPSHVVGLFA